MKQEKQCDFPAGGNKKLGTFFDRKPVGVEAKGISVTSRGQFARQPMEKGWHRSLTLAQTRRKPKRAPILSYRTGAHWLLAFKPMETEGRTLLHVFSALDGDLHNLGGIEFTIAAFGGFCHGTCEIGEGLSRDGFGA